MSFYNELLNLKVLLDSPLYSAVLTALAVIKDCPLPSSHETPGMYGDMAYKLIKEMIHEDLILAEKENIVKMHGYKVLNRFE